MCVWPCLCIHGHKSACNVRPPSLCVDRRPAHAARGLPAQRRVHPDASHGRAAHRRTDAVQSRRESLPRPLLRQQAQLVSGRRGGRSQGDLSPSEGETRWSYFLVAASQQL